MYIYQEQGTPISLHHPPAERTYIHFLNIRKKRQKDIKKGLKESKNKRTASNRKINKDHIEDHWKNNIF